MPVTDVHHDMDTLTLHFTAEFAAPVERIWEIYTSPRQLEKWFGPPTHPATFVDLDLRPAGRATYYMTGPDGEKYCGWWEFIEVEPTSRLVYKDGFADQDFNPSPSMPVSHNEYRFTDDGGRTRVTTVSRYETAADLQKVLDMGAVEGATLAINQIDELLAQSHA